MIYLIRKPSGQRYNSISSYLPVWFVLSAVIFLHSSINPTYITSIYWEWWQYVLRFLPLIVVLYLGYSIVKAVNIEMIKAYEADYKYTAKYRRKYIEEHHTEILNNEAQIYKDFNRNVANWRMRLILFLCLAGDSQDEDRLITYYREPILLLKLAQLHYSRNHVQGHKVAESSAKEIELPSTFDINRIERDIQSYYFDQEVLKEYVYLISTRFTNQDQQEELQELVRIYAIDTGLTVEQQNRIETKRKWRERQSEEQWKEIEDNWKLASQERRLKAEDYMDRMRAKLTQQRANENNSQLLDELDNMRIEYNRRKLELGKDASLSDIERKEQLRILQRTYIAQIDDFGDRL
jgi:hypothetical protein